VRSDLKRVFNDLTDTAVRRGYAKYTHSSWNCHAVFGAIFYDSDINGNFYLLYSASVKLNAWGNI
jgi:hypothetical protein